MEKEEKTTETPKEVGREVHSEAKGGPRERIRDSKGTLVSPISKPLLAALGYDRKQKKFKKIRSLEPLRAVRLSSAFLADQ